MQPTKEDSLRDAFLKLLNHYQPVQSEPQLAVECILRDLHDITYSCAIVEEPNEEMTSGLFSIHNLYKFFQNPSVKEYIGTLKTE